MKDGEKGFGAKSVRQLRISSAFGAIRISQGHSGNISFGDFATRRGIYPGIQVPPQNRTPAPPLSSPVSSVRSEPSPLRRRRPREESASSVRRLKDGKSGRNARSSSLSDLW